MAYSPVSHGCGPRFKTEEEWKNYAKLIFCYRLLKDKGYTKEESQKFVDHNSIRITGTIDELIKWCEAMPPRDIVYGEKQGNDAVIQPNQE